MQDKGNKIEEYIRNQNKRTFHSIKIHSNIAILSRLGIQDSTFSIEPYLSIVYSVVPESIIITGK